VIIYTGNNNEILNVIEKKKRAGRSGRAGRKGYIYSLYHNKDEKIIDELK